VIVCVLFVVGMLNVRAYFYRDVSTQVSSKLDAVKSHIKQLQDLIQVRACDVVRGVCVCPYVVFVILTIFGAHRT
jgi:hypothetical protein